ncbi:TonB family protein [Hymenobacter sp. HDW8]|uniref:TonB family protein n=1 Tax=Hymenobacter sp. HDW8 TaxID=2714932 RepID=UPI0014098F50|nr:TonB family protein [Hymenobacter sp. HDW8]QIL78441.1 TonB family protein [Hymenobacter sp. HDW8]
MKISFYPSLLLPWLLPSLVLPCLLTSPQPVVAQTRPHQPPQSVYVNVPHMPELPTGGGLAALTAAVQRQVKYPVAAQRQGVQGTVTIAFTVLADGSLTDVYAQGLDYGCPEAATAALRGLPRLKPGRRQGQAVPVRMSLPVQFVLAGLPAEGRAEARATPSPAARQQQPVEPGDTSRVWPTADQMPRLPDGSGSYAVGALLQRTLVPAPDVQAGHIEGRVFVRFTVGTSGVVRDAVVVKPLSAGADAAALQTVARLPRFLPATHNGQPVAISLTVPLTFYGPNHTYNRAPGSQPVPPMPDVDAYLQQQVRVPAVVAAQQLSGLVGVGAVVMPDGQLDSLKVVRPLCAACDAELLRLVRGLPRYQPGRDEAGRAVAVRTYLEVRMPPNPPDSISRVYTYVEQMPQLPNAASISATIQELLGEPGGQAAPGQRRVFVSFTVGPHGGVYAVKLQKGVGGATDAAVLAAVQRLPRFVPGKQNGRPVAVSFTVPVVVK